MKSPALTPDEYINLLPDERKIAFSLLRKTIAQHLPKGFEEGIQYHMIGYYVPFSIYPKGYHCNAKEPLPFLSIASQKNSINIYHMGMYAMPKIQQWFVDEYAKQSTLKLDMGKSCIRFKKIDAIPLDLIAKLCQKLSPQDWISVYESMYLKMK